MPTVAAVFLRLPLSSLRDVSGVGIKIPPMTHYGGVDVENLKWRNNKEIHVIPESLNQCVLYLRMETVSYLY